MFRLRTLNCQLTIVIRHVSQIDVEALGMLLHPGPILIDIRSVDYEEEIVLPHLIDQKVINSSTVLVAHHAIIDLTHRGTRNIICKDMLHIALGIFTSHDDLSHVRHIEETYLLTYCKMLRSDASILDGHFKAAKG